MTDNRDPDAISATATNSFCQDERNRRPTSSPRSCPAPTVPRYASCADVAGALGLSIRTFRVVAGSIDNTAAAIGLGAVDARTVPPAPLRGTSSWVAAHVPFKKTDPPSRRWRRFPVPCRTGNPMTALQATAGGNLTFLRDNVLYPDDELACGERTRRTCSRSWTKHRGARSGGGHTASSTRLGSGANALPSTTNTLRAGSLQSVPSPNNRADVVRAFLEGVALNTRWLA